MRTIRVCISSGGRVIIDHPASTRDTSMQVTDIPETVLAADVIAQVSRVVIWPWPRLISWSTIAGKPIGAIIRTGETVRRLRHL